VDSGKLFQALIIMPPPRGHYAVIGVRCPSVRLSVCLSDVAYIGFNSKTKRPRKTKLCTGVPQVTCDSHTDFKVKRSKVKVTGRGRGGILWRPPSRTACSTCKKTAPSGACTTGFVQLVHVATRYGASPRFTFSSTSLSDYGHVLVLSTKRKIEATE